MNLRIKEIPPYILHCNTGNGEDSKDMNRIEDGLDYLLTHFQEPVWPRTISTKTTEGKQIVVFSMEEVLARFKQTKGLDCRINAYPNYVEWNGLNRQPPNFIFIDMDSKDSIDLDQFLGCICGKFDDYSIQPTVIDSGRGYHFYLPIRAFVLEEESLFANFANGQASRAFIQRAEQFLSNGKADKCHSLGLSFKNCMLRVPGSINSRVNEGVKVVKRWNGRRPSTRVLLEEFYIDMTENRINEIEGEVVKTPVSRNTMYQYWRSR